MAFTVLAQEEVPAEFPIEEPMAPAPLAQSRDDVRARQAADLMALAVRALGKRALVAIAAMFSLLTAGSVFWLALVVSWNPTPKQLILVGIYGLFVIVLHLVKAK